MVECNFYGVASKAGNFVGWQEESKATTFENCKLKTQEYLDVDFGLIFGQMGNIPNEKRVNKYNLIKNCEIKTTAHGQGLNYIVVTNYDNCLTLNGVVIREKSGEENNLLFKSSTGIEEYKSLIVEKTNYKYVFGTNLKPFYWSWKTGEIGVKTVDGNGLFQGDVDEEFLNNKGYQIVI